MAVGLSDGKIAFPIMDQIIQETGLPLTHMISQGCIHMLAMPQWMEKYPDAIGYTEPIRIPKLTTIGRDMYKKYHASGRIKALPETGPIFPEFQNQIRFHLIKGIGVHVDVDVSTKMGMCCNMRAMNNPKGGPACEVYTFHVASGLLCVGDNLGWYYPANVKLPFVLKAMGTKPGVFQANPKVMAPLDYKTLHACWENVLAEDIKYITGYHEAVKVQIEGNAKARLREALEKGHQLDDTAPGGCAIL